MNANIDFGDDESVGDNKESVSTKRHESCENELDSNKEWRSPTLYAPPSPPTRHKARSVKGDGPKDDAFNPTESEESIPMKPTQKTKKKKKKKKKKRRESENSSSLFSLSRSRY